MFALYSRRCVCPQPTRWQGRFAKLDAGGFLSLPFNFLLPLRLAGTIPPELGKLTALQRLYMNENQLNGESLGPVFRKSNIRLSGCSIPR